MSSSDTEARSKAVEELVESILKEQFGLGNLGVYIIRKWLRKMAADDPDGRLERFKKWFMLVLSQKSSCVILPKDCINSWQWGCPDMLPGLTAAPFWEVSTLSSSTLQDLFRFVTKLEHLSDTILDELLATKVRMTLKPFKK